MEWYQKWVSNFFAGAITSVMFITLSPIIHYFVGWVLSLTFVGNWIVAGLNIMLPYHNFVSGELKIIAAGMGFLSAFLTTKDFKKEDKKEVK